MNQTEAREIFLQALPELSEPLKSAVEFALANWHKLNREPRASDVAITFFASLPDLPSNDVDEVFAAKLNEMAKLLRDDPTVWISLDDLPHEEWRDVVGYEGLYKISNFGRVKSFHNHKLPQILRINPNVSGYATVALSKNNKMASRGVHILVAEAFLPNPQKLPVVHHIDNTKTNSCIWNLAWVTYSENANIAYQTGRKKSIGCVKKLTPEQVRYIRKHFIKGNKEFGSHALAKKFNVKPQTILDVVNYKRYKNVT